MSLNDAIADHAETVFLRPDIFGDPVTYTPAGGDGVDLTAAVGSVEINDEQPYAEGRLRRRRREVLISTDPTLSCGGVASPAENATVTIDSVQWSVDRVELLPGGLAKLHLTRPESIERSRPGYRSQT